MASQNSSLSDSQPITAPIPPRKTKTSRKAPALKSAVIIKRAQGMDKTRISKDLGIARNTVTAILDESDVEQQILAGQSLSANLIPEAIRVAKFRLSANSENMAIKVLENTIWPLQSVTSKGKDTGLTLAIQNLMGNMTVTTSNSVPADNPTQQTPIDVQVIENK